MIQEASPRRVKVVLVDPWDLVTTAGSGPFGASIAKSGLNQIGRATMLVRLDKPFMLSGDKYHYFVATARHENSSLEDLERNLTITCNLIRIPSDRAEGSNPFDLSWWRGGGAAIADLSLE